MNYQTTIGDQQSEYRIKIGRLVIYKIYVRKIDPCSKLDKELENYKKLPHPPASTVDAP